MPLLLLMYVPRTGLEPARYCYHWSLKPACLPISPPGRGGVGLGVGVIVCECGFVVPRTRIELACPCGHMALNHARIPVPPPGRWSVCLGLGVGVGIGTANIKKCFIYSKNPFPIPPTF